MDETTGSPLAVDIVLRYAVPSGFTAVWTDATYARYAPGVEHVVATVAARLQALGPAPPTGGTPLSWAIKQLTSPLTIVAPIHFSAM